ncbi:MAG TPA: hypothetical protein VMT24_01785, partial [Aggregatilineaceae bacterium]|nr:hypothetical protein [Aggregatilineaceae bacterium]
MSHDVQRCPHCGAYVMGERTICPRCDHPLNEPPSDRDSVSDSYLLADESGAAGDQAAPEAGSAGIPLDDQLVSGEGLEAPAQDRWNAATTQLPQAGPIMAGTPNEPVEAGDEGSIGDLPGSLPDEREDLSAQETGSVGPESGAPVIPEAEDGLEPAAEAEAPLGVPMSTADAAAVSGADQGEGWRAMEPEADDTPESAPRAADTARSGVEEGQGPPQPEGVAVGAPEPVETQPHLEEQLGEPAEPEVDAAELPTARYATDSDEPAPEAGSTIVAGISHRQAGLAHPAYIVPPAPYTPPPVPSPLPPAWITPPPAPAYALPVEYGYSDPAAAYFQQRVQAYIRGGYRVHVHGPQEAT